MLPPLRRPWLHGGLWTTALVEAQGYQRFLLSRPVVGQNIAVRAAPADRASNSLVSAFPIHSTSFPPKPLRSSTAERVINSESERLLVVAVHFVSS